MFEDYQASKEDLEAIEEGIKTAWRPEMDFVFKDRNLLKNIVVISYDSKFLYVWTKFKLSHKIPHKIKLKDEWQLGWQASLTIKDFFTLLPKKFPKSDFKIPKMSGGLLTPFVELQKKKKIKNNQYITYESFLATIVHEFGHLYWNQHKLWWYSNKKENINYLKTAKELYQKKGKIPRIFLHLPLSSGIGELFAFCVEYWASELFWPSHKKNLDVFIDNRIKELIKIEEKKDLEREDSVLEPNQNPHDFAFVFGKIILTQHPKTWPEILTQPKLMQTSQTFFPNRKSS